MFIEHIFVSWEWTIFVLAYNIQSMKDSKILLKSIFNGHVLINYVSSRLSLLDHPVVVYIALITSMSFVIDSISFGPSSAT